VVLRNDDFVVNEEFSIIINFGHHFVGLFRFLSGLRVLGAFGSGEVQKTIALDFHHFQIFLVFISLGFRSTLGFFRLVSFNALRSSFP